MGLIGSQNSQKTHRFRLRFPETNDAFYVQKVTPPTVEAQEVKHGGPANMPDIKTPGKVVVGDLVVEMIRPTTELNDNGIWQGMASAVAGNPAEIFSTCFFDHLQANGIAVQQTFVGTMAWVKKIETSESSNKDDADNVMVTVTISVNAWYPQDSPEMAALFASNAIGAAGNA